MTERGAKARQTLLKRFGSEENLREHYREMQQKSRQHPNNQKGQHRGGFSNKEFAKQMSQKGLHARIKANQAPENQDSA